ncbi:hypothetical protein [Marispirochaeta aestuarii]|uniref:hypothetical protein n=1 Tax=Marispirochaeta aestuarii TaxID=1963862 RepID=UPI0029C84EBA|nr:hypothetical protein [Marispirochaeta aestuarii]
MNKLSAEAEVFLKQLTHLKLEDSVWVPQHLNPILDKCDVFIKDNIQNIINELEEKNYIQESPKGFKLTQDGYNFLWSKYTVKVKCPHCGKEI